MTEKVEQERGWRKTLSRFAVRAGLGAVMALGQMPFDLPWFGLAAVVAVFALPGLWPAVMPFAMPFASGPKARFKTGFGAGWAVGCGYFLVALHWIYHPFMVDPARDGWMAPFGLFFMITGIALFWGAAFGVARVVGQGRMWPLALVAAWAGTEMLRAHILTGFPWAMLSHGWIGRGFGQTAALWGAHGMTLVVLGVGAVVGCGLARLLAAWTPRHGAGQDLSGGKAPVRKAWALVILPLAAFAGFDRALDPGAAPAAAADAPIVRIVQPNVPQKDKADPDAIPVYVRRLMDLSAQDGARDLVVWPETALPWLLDYMPDLLPATADAAAAPLAMGVMRNEGSVYFNSMALIGAGGQVDAVYDKRHLVPFGEYVPFGDLLARFGIRGLAAADGAGYVAGQGAGLIDIPGIGAAWPMICYESIFPEEIVAHSPRPRFILLVTNDAWFGDFAGPYQHFAQGRLRAIETGLPLVRAANTGVSAMIDGKGRIIAQLPLNVADKIDAPLPPALPPTPYSQGGDWPIAVTLCLLLAIAALTGRKKGIDRASAPL